MLTQEWGTCSGSDLFFFTPSQKVRNLLFFSTAVGYYFTDYDYHIERAYYPEYLLFYICDGRLSVRSENRTMVANAGQVGLLNCHRPHEYHTIGNTEFIWIHFCGSNTHEIYEQIVKLYGGYVFDTSNAKTIHDEIYSILHACRHNQLMTELQISFKLYGMMLSLLGLSLIHI